VPFTLSHAVVALPFRRTVLTPSAIAAGAMVPDLPLFFPVLPVHEAYGATHSWWGVPTIDLVLAAVALLAWYAILRPASTALAPGWLRSRFPADWGAPQRLVVSWRPRAVISLLVSMILGSATHVAWDLFTHPARAGAEWLPALATNWGPLPGYDWLQYGSSVLGVVVLAIGAVVWLRARPVAPQASRMPRWLSSGAWALAALVFLWAIVVDVAVQGVPTSLSGLVFRVGVPVSPANSPCSWRPRSCSSSWNAYDTPGMRRNLQGIRPAHRVSPCHPKGFSGRSAPEPQAERLPRPTGSLLLKQGVRRTTMENPPLVQSSPARSGSPRDRGLAVRGAVGLVVG
jgi:hypothetical protein